MKRSTSVVRLVVWAVLTAWGLDARAQEAISPSSLDKRLLEVAEKGISASVQQLLEKGANIEARDDQGRTALILAASRRRDHTIKLLLQKGADVEAKDNDGDTALISAARVFHDSPGTLKILLEHGADVEAKDNEGKTALHRAALMDDGRAVKLLLEKGANVEAKDNEGGTALMEACKPIASPFFFEIDFGPLAKLLLGIWETPKLLSSAFSHPPDTVKALLEHGADVKAKNNLGETALHWATLSGQARNLKLLLRKGADVEAKDELGSTALHWAAFWGQVRSLKVLLRRGADVETKDDNGDTALLKAAGAYHRSADTVKVLLEHGANVRAKDNEGHTARTVAARMGNTDVIKLLKKETEDSRSDLK